MAVSYLPTLVQVRETVLPKLPYIFEECEAVVSPEQELYFHTGISQTLDPSPSLPIPIGLMVVGVGVK